MLDSKAWWNVTIIKVKGVTKSISNGPRDFGYVVRPLT